MSKSIHCVGGFLLALTAFQAGAQPADDADKATGSINPYVYMSDGAKNKLYIETHFWRNDPAYDARVLKRMSDVMTELEKLGFKRNNDAGTGWEKPENLVRCPDQPGVDCQALAWQDRDGGGMRGNGYLRCRGPPIGGSETRAAGDGRLRQAVQARQGQARAVNRRLAERGDDGTSCVRPVLCALPIARVRAGSRATTGSGPTCNNASARPKLFRRVRCADRSSFIELFRPVAVSVTMRNTGTATWFRSDGDVFLATQGPQDNYFWCIQDNPHGMYRGNRVLLPYDVPPGEDVTFDFVEPLTCGFAATAPFRFRMLSQMHGTFGEASPDAEVHVSTAAEFTSRGTTDAAPASAEHWRHGYLPEHHQYDMAALRWLRAGVGGADGEYEVGHVIGRARQGSCARRPREVQLRHRSSRRSGDLQFPVANELGRECAIGQPRPRRRRSGCRAGPPELPGSLVGKSRRQGIRLGHQRRPSGRRALRDVVHLRRERQRAMAFDDG